MTMEPHTSDLFFRQVVILRKSTATDLRRTRGPTHSPRVLSYTVLRHGFDQVSDALRKRRIFHCYLEKPTISGRRPDSPSLQSLIPGYDISNTLVDMFAE